ncbi:MAG: 5-oxoprolinase/urea amidolyase family protein, partial [Planctomycetota bacterium]
PQASPGGWNVIGRTATTLFDPRAGRPSLILPGDRVRFHPVNEHAPPVQTPAAIADDGSITAATNVPVLRVISPGVQTTLQDFGRVGWQAVGVSPAGAMDRRSLQVANLLAGARPDATAIEATLVGPVLEALASVTIGVAGALPRRCPAPRRLMLREGDRLDLRELAGCARCYVGIAGGFAGDEVLGSASTDLRGGFGGFAGRALAAGDTLHASSQEESPPAKSIAAAPTGLIAGSVTELRVLRGPYSDWLTESAGRQLFESLYNVTPQSSRVGLRCDGRPLAFRPAVAKQVGGMESQPVATGAIQVPPNGQPVVLGADRQTIGGYPIVGCVISADLPMLGQLSPGDRVRFREMSLAEAERLRSEADRWLAIAAAGIQLADQSP